MQEVKSIIVTGSNKGIGLAIVTQILKKNYYNKIIMTTRSQQKYESAITELKTQFGEDQISNKIDGLILDLMDETSIQNFTQQVQQQYGQVDCLLNNAGVYLRQSSDNSAEDRYRLNVTTNYIHTKLLADAFLEKNLIKETGKLIFMSSQLGKLSFMKSKNPQFYDKLVNYKQFSLEDVDRIFNEYWNDLSQDFESGKWPISYFTSKMFLSIYCNALSRSSKIIERNIGTYSCHPGYIKTDMTKLKWGDSNGPNKNPTQGSKSAVYLAHLPQGIDSSTQGAYFNDNAVIEEL